MSTYKLSRAMTVAGGDFSRAQFFCFACSADRQTAPRYLCLVCGRFLVTVTGTHFNLEVKCRDCHTVTRISRAYHFFDSPRSTDRIPVLAGAGTDLRFTLDCPTCSIRIVLVRDSSIRHVVESASTGVVSGLVTSGSARPPH